MRTMSAVCRNPLVVVWGVLLVGCAKVEPRADYERAASIVSETTGLAECYQPGTDDLVADKVDQLLAGGLSAKEAVQVCLLNNPALQAAYLEIGIARADVVQSTLFSNPTLAMSVQFPEGGGRSNLQAGLAQNIVDLWQIPIRKRVAEHALDEAILSLANQAVQIALDAESAYFATQGAEARLAILRENLQLAERLLDLTKARQQAGAAGELDVNLARGPMLSAELEMQQARLEAASARRRLATLLGLEGDAANLALTTELPLPPEALADPEAFVETARRHRLDLQAARRAAETALARLEQEYREVVPEFVIGAELERSERRAQGGRKILADTVRASAAAGTLTAPEIQPRSARRAEDRQEIDSILGPSLSLTLPIFDQNQAQIARARFAYEQAIKQAAALELAVVQEVRQRVDETLTAWQVVRFYESDLLPQVQVNLDLSQESYRAGRTNVIVLIDAQRALLAARRAAVEARQAAAVALTQLERSTGRSLSTAVPTTAPATEPLQPTPPSSEQNESEPESPPGDHS